ncbi:MAG: hypothetical protein KY445_07755 [Armatimonadetes bacterium]|nr:hypothetical protein [Armatimonadota bacterium]
MNKTEKKIILRLENCLRIPKAISGATRTPSFESYIGFAKDMDYAVDKAKSILNDLRCGETWEGRIEEELTDFEDWHKRRTSEEWKT